jgi:hypothetical protein
MSRGLGMPVQDKSFIAKKKVKKSFFTESHTVVTQAPYHLHGTNKELILA